MQSVETDQCVFGRPNCPIGIDCRPRIGETAVLSTKNRTEGPWVATGWRCDCFGEMAKNASSIQKLLKIAAKSKAEEAIRSRSVFARSRRSDGGARPARRWKRYNKTQRRKHRRE